MSRFCGRSTLPRSQGEGNSSSLPESSWATSEIFLKVFMRLLGSSHQMSPRAGLAVTGSELLRDYKKEFKQNARVRPRFSLPADLRVGMDGEAEDGELPRT